MQGKIYYIECRKKLWPGERDSNPRRCYPQRFSRPPLSTAQPSPELKYILEATLGFEPRNQGFAGPCLTTWLCRQTLWCPKPDLNRYGSNIRGILSPLCLPIPPPGHYHKKIFDLIEEKTQLRAFEIYSRSQKMERETGFEPATPTLARLCSTTELFPRKLLQGFKPVILATLLEKIKAKSKNHNFILQYLY